MKKDVRAKTAHGQQPGTSMEPVLPPKPDIRPNYGREWNENEVNYAAMIPPSKRIPLDGPEDSRMRVLIASVVLFVWVGWFVMGAVRFSLTGNSIMLLASPVLLLFPLGIVLKYYFSRKHRRPAGSSRRSRKAQVKQRPRRRM